MTRLARLSLAGVALAVACAACAGIAGRSEDATRPTPSVPTLTSVPPSDKPVTGEVPTDILHRLVADAADRANVDEGSVEVIRAAQTTWNDGSLDCPEPGMFYTQALIQGYHVVLVAADEELDYRVTADGGFRLCEDASRRPAGG